MRPPSLPSAWGGDVLSACFRACPEDFRVEELPGFEPTGSGEHLVLEVCKTGQNTVWVAQALARWAGISERGVGYAGLKDRHAVTVQRFSLHLPRRTAPDIGTLDLPGVQVLDARWHHRKLPRGALAGNRFLIRLRDVRGDPEAIGERLRAVASAGVPNAFGAQRFGRDGGNLDRALAMFAGARVKRQERSILLSAARSAIFNAVLARRIACGDWNTGGEGEVWMLDGSHSIFGPQAVDDALRARVVALDVHPTGPLWGRGALRTTGAVAGLESEVAADWQALADGLEHAGLNQERRALRVRVDGLSWRFENGDELELAFTLPAGSYATAVLQALGAVEEAGR